MHYPDILPACGSIRTIVLGDDVFLALVLGRLVTTSVATGAGGARAAVFRAVFNYLAALRKAITVATGLGITGVNANSIKSTGSSSRSASLVRSADVMHHLHIPVKVAVAAGRSAVAVLVLMHNPNV
jgi:hypothetical protein